MDAKNELILGLYNMGMMMNYGMRLELLVCHIEIDQTILWYIKLTKLSRD